MVTFQIQFGAHSRFHMETGAPRGGMDEQMESRELAVEAQKTLTNLLHADYMLLGTTPQHRKQIVNEVWQKVQQHPDYRYVEKRQRSGKPEKNTTDPTEVTTPAVIR